METASPSEVGAVAEREVAYALGRSGFDVYLPVFGAHSRIDLLAVRQGRVTRVQVKSGRLVGEAVVFHTCSNTANVSRDYLGEVDAFGVHAPELGTSYLVPIADAPMRACYLRTAPPKNNQVKGIRWAEDYSL